MNKILENRNLLVLWTVLFITAGSCTNSTNSSASPTATINNIQRSSPADKTKKSDEQLFRDFFNKFKVTLRAKKKAQLTLLVHFPLQTAPQWTNDELKNTAFTPKEGLIDVKEFKEYFDDIFSKNTIKLILESSDDDLSEIESSTTEDYYKTLKQVTDKSSVLYELQKQYVQANGKETSFGFVFGKIGGTYKVVSFYRPWPLK